MEKTTNGLVIILRDENQLVRPAAGHPLANTHDSFQLLATSLDHWRPQPIFHTLGPGFD